MGTFWAVMAQVFWWFLFAVCAVGFVVMSIVLILLAVYFNDKEKLAATK